MYTKKMFPFDKKNWVLWKSEKRGGKITKIPYSLSGKMASSTDPLTWDTYENVKNKKGYSGIGFVLPLDNTILGIDLDKCLDENKKIINKDFQLFVKKANTYTEISPSQKGLHLFFYVKDGVQLKAHRSSKCLGFEVYSSGRYFTFTSSYYEELKKMRSISQEEVDNLLSIVRYPWIDKKDDKKEQNIISITLSDEEIMQRMFDSKNGEKIRKLWNGDISQQNNDDSAADMALCMHLSFWTQKNQERVRSLWLLSPLGQRKKTQSRKDYQDVTISHAISATREVYTPYAEEEFAKSFDLMVNKKGIPFINAENVMRIIDKDELLSKSFRYNSFNHSEETNLGDTWKEIDKQDITFCILHIQRTYTYFEKISRQTVEDAITGFCIKNTVNPPKKWIESLEWDGEYRLDHWLTNTYGTLDDEYYSAVGANWFKGLVKRVMEPGCKFDFIMILEGPQGWKKSTSLSILGNGYHVETILAPENKDFFMIMGRNIIVEFSEGYTMNRSDTRLLKSIVTMNEDQYRVPYGRGITRFPRHCVFAMTTNESAYLRDETGNRRFLPVEVKKVADIEWLESNVEQLYAEAYKRAILDKETVWEFPENAADIQNARMIENPYSEKLLNWYFSIPEQKRNEEGITVIEAYITVWQDNVALGREMSVLNTMQVAGLLTSVLKLKKKKSMRNGITANRWFPTDTTPKIEQMYSTETVFQEF